MEGRGEEGKPTYIILEIPVDRKQTAVPKVGLRIGIRHGVVHNSILSPIVPAATPGIEHRALEIRLDLINVLLLCVKLDIDRSSLALQNGFDQSKRVVDAVLGRHDG